MRRRTTFIDVYRYRKNRHAVLSRRGGVDRLPLRNEEVRGSIPLGSTTASPDTVATICLLPEPLPDEFGQLVLQLVLLGHTNGHRPGGDRQAADNPRRALNRAQVGESWQRWAARKARSPSAPDFDSGVEGFESLRARQ